MTEHTLSPEHKRVRWRCHRGMLEIDLLLLPYCDNVYMTLSAQEKAQFEAFLECTDPEIFSWLMGHVVCDDVRIQSIVDKIRQYHQDAV